MFNRRDKVHVEVYDKPIRIALDKVLTDTTSKVDMTVKRMVRNQVWKIINVEILEVVYHKSYHSL